MQLLTGVNSHSQENENLLKHMKLKNIHDMRMGVLHHVSDGLKRLPSVILNDLLPKKERRLIQGHHQHIPHSGVLFENMGCRRLSNAAPLKFGKDKELAHIPVYIRTGPRFIKLWQNP